MFDEFVEEVLVTLDDMAERIRMIGQDVQNVQLKQMQETADVHSSVAGQSVREMIEEACSSPCKIMRTMRCCRWPT